MKGHHLKNKLPSNIIKSSGLQPFTLPSDMSGSPREPLIPEVSVLARTEGSFLMMHNRVGSMVLAEAVTAGPRLPQPHGSPPPATRRAQSGLRAARSWEPSPCPPLDPRAAPPGLGLSRVSVPAQFGLSPGRRLEQDSVSSRACPAERAGPAGTCF